MVQYAYKWLPLISERNTHCHILRSFSHLTREGVSVGGIRNALKEIGMESATFEMTTKQLRDNCPLPAILHWEQNHFVVLYDVKYHRLKKLWYFYIAKPAYSKTKFNEEEFSHFWLNGPKGIVVAVEPTTAFCAKASAYFIAQFTVNGGQSFPFVRNNCYLCGY